MKSLREIIESHLSLLPGSARDKMPYIVAYANLATLQGDEEALVYLSAANYLEADPSLTSPQSKSGLEKVAQSGIAANANRKVVDETQTSSGENTDRSLWYRVTSSSFPAAEVSTADALEGLKEEVELGHAYKFNAGRKQKVFALREDRFRFVYGNSGVDLGLVESYIQVQPSIDGIKRGSAVSIGHRVKKGETIRLTSKPPHQFLVPVADLVKYEVEHLIPKKKVSK